MARLIQLMKMQKRRKTITVNDVKKWFEKNVEKKKQLSGYNSFVAPYAKYEYEIDLFFMTKMTYLIRNLG